MDCSGKIIQIAQDFATKGILVTLSLTDVSVQELQVLKEIERLAVNLKKWKKKRSLDANAYYWKLLTELAEILCISKPRAHNMMLRKYGQHEFIDGHTLPVPIPDTDAAEEQALEAQTYHIKPTSQVKEGKDGQMYRTYVMLRGSSDYNTYEMSKLIDGLVSDCKELGIETMTPAEIERMMAAYEKKHSN